MLRTLLAGVAAAHIASAAYCNGRPSANAQPNLYPVDSSPLTLINTTKNGIAYEANSGSGFEFYVVQVYGTAYEMGYAQGSLFPTEVKNMTGAVWAYMVDQVAENLAFLPTWLADLIGDVGLEAALDVLLDLTKPFTGPYIWEEMQGMADASGADLATLKRIHLIGELTQGDCSMYGASGPATLGGKTLQLRALDWDTEGPFNNHPAVIVYHPSQDGHAFANVGFLSWVGTLTGQSSVQMAISEIGVSYPDTTHFGNESFVGIPFVFLLRDILQFDGTYVDAVNRITNANRTCDLILGVGDGKPAAQTFRGFAYSASQLEVYDYTNMQPWNATGNTWHPRFDHITYWGMDWLCPNYNTVLAAQLAAGYGKLTPELTIQNITSIVQTGDTHIGIYDLTDSQLYVSFMARPDSAVQNPRFAYDRQFTRLNLTALFSEPAPTL